MSPRPLPLRIETPKDLRSRVISGCFAKHQVCAYDSPFHPCRQPGQSQLRGVLASTARRYHSMRPTECLGQMFIHFCQPHVAENEERYPVEEIGDSDAAEHHQRLV